MDPQQVHGQVEGAVVMAASETLMEEVRFDERGRVVNPNLQAVPRPCAQRGTTWCHGHSRRVWP